VVSARSSWATFVDGTAVLSLADMTSDQLHPTPLGAAKYADYVATLINPLTAGNVAQLAQASNQLGCKPSTCLLPTSNPAAGQVLVAMAPSGGFTQLTWATPTGGALTVPGRVAGCQVNSTPAVSTLNCTVTGLVGGEMIVVHDYHNLSATVSSLVDSGGGTVTPVDNTTFYTSYKLDRNYIKNAAAGSHTITLTLSGAVNYPVLFVDVFARASTTYPLDTTQLLVGSCTTGTYTGTAITTGAVNEAVFVLVYAASAATLTPGTGYTSYTNSVPNTMLESIVPSAAGSITPTVGGMAAATPGCFMSEWAIK
jgi:hypothetical protein